MGQFRLKILISAIFLQVFLLNFNAQTVSIKTVLDTNRILPGQRANLKFVINKSPETTVKLPFFGDTLSDGIEVLGNIRVDSTRLSQSSEQIEQSMDITGFEPGLRYIAPQPFILKTSTGTDTMYSTPGYIRIDSVAIDTTGTIRDIKQIEWVRPTLRDFLPAIIILAVIGLIVFLVIFFWPGNREKILKSSPKIVEPPHIIALRELDKLKAQKLWQQKLTKEYYSRLTNIIRTYIEQQFGIKAMEETTSEILRDIYHLKLESKLSVSDLQKLLNLADLVKFARGDAEPEENIEHLERAYDFIKSSRQSLMEDAVKDTAEIVQDKLAHSYQISAKTKNARGKSDLQIFQELENGGRLVRYQYTISIIVMTFSRNSKIYLIKSNEKGIKQGIIYSAITMLLGWWGIPWGPVRSYDSLKSNFSGGKNVELE